jgi:cellulose synthase/poly-beta-1,6-N-acetylglucosamine synthase-like glycosyltransferase
MLAFWGAVAVIAYTYAGFPMLVLARAAVRPRPYVTGDVRPPISVLIAAHNEAAAMGPKLESVLAAAYRDGHREVIVASDGSDDGTEEVVRRFEGRGVRLLALPRVGKAAALNEAIAAATGEVLVFTDANSALEPDALIALVRPFADPSVGGVAGDQRYRKRGDEAAVAGGERSYWGFDRLLKVAESRAGNAISATGALYAVRRDLVGEVPEGVTDDFATSTGVIAAGSRLVFVPEAVAWEPVASSGELEFGRKVRVMTRGLRAVVVRRELLDARRHGFYAVQLVSHKVLRRLMVVPLAVLAVSSPALWRRGRLYRLATVGQALFYGAGALGLLSGSSTRRRGGGRLLALPAFFCLVNAAAVKACWNLVTGRRIDRWEPQRSPS